MADLRSATASPLGITNPLVADVKRPSEVDAAGGFVDVMLARLTAISHDDDDLKAIVKEQDSNCEISTEADKNLRHMDGVKKPDKAEAIDSEAAVNIEKKVKEKIKSRVREVMSQDTTPVKDNRPQKLLKKVAEFLLKANEKGDINLPAEMVAKLQDFVAKDPATMSAGEVGLVMRDLIETFKSLRVSMTDKPVSEQGTTRPPEIAVWPNEMVEAFKELNLNPGIEANKPVTTMVALRALKSLVKLAENGALSALNEKKQALIQAIDPEHVLLGIQSVDNSEAAIAKIASKEEVLLSVKPADDGEAAITKTASKDEALLSVQPVDDSEVASVKTPKPMMEQVKNSPVPQTLMEVLDSSENNVVKQAALATQIAMPEAKADKTKVVADVQAALTAAPVADPKAVAAAVDVAAKKVSARESASQAFDKGLMNAKFEKAAPRAEMPVVAQPMRADAVQAVATAKPFEAMVQTHVSHAAPVADVSAISNEAMPARFNTSAAQTSVKVAHLPPSPATQQVMVNIQQKMNGNSQLSVNLTPAELGRVDMRVTIKADGTAHTVVTVDRPETLALLQKDSVHLERALQHAGLNANQENMSFNLREQRQAQQGFGQHRKRSLRDNDSIKIQDIALNVHDGRIISDNRVNYHA